MNYYETILIFDGRIEDSKYKPCVDHYIKKITDFGGLFRTVDRMGKKKLAYSLKRDGMEVKDGWYAVFTYKGKAGSDLIAKLETEFRKDDTVLKFLTVRRDPEEDELSEYAEVAEIEEEAKSPAEINVESEQSSGLNSDCWDKVFSLQEVD